MGTTTGGAYPGTGSGTKTGGTVDKSKVQSMAMNWPQASRKALEATVQKYGMPTEMTNTMAVWKNSGPFLKTVVFSEEIPHRFPKPHSDVLEQTIYYRVPPDRFDDLAQFDGSIKADRTKGTLSARCDSEANNILALNLANDIITGAKSVEEARQFLATTAASATPGTGQPGQGGGQGQTGQNADYTRTLRFQVQMAGTADPDQPNAQTTQFGDEDEKK
jgi:hypothetical protein